MTSRFSETEPETDSDQIDAGKILPKLTRTTGIIIDAVIIWSRSTILRLE
jgi:hypothetical protein